MNRHHKSSQSNFYTLLVIVFLSVAITASAQKNTPVNVECQCSKNSYTHKIMPDTVIELSNHQKFSICGHKQLFRDKIYFSEFDLSICGEDSFVKFWHALQLCKVESISDTLFVIEQKNLPVDTSDSLCILDWETDKFYFTHGKLNHSYHINKGIPKYDGQQIQFVLKEFELATKGADEKKMSLLRRLFVATISGSKTARKYFLDYEKKIGALDGIYAEDYDDLKNMLKLWDKNI